MGVDVAFNYKSESTEEILQREGPLDVYVLSLRTLVDYVSLTWSYMRSYWDGVGGQTLDLALKYANKNARFIVRSCFICYLGT